MQTQVGRFPIGFFYRKSSFLPNKNFANQKKLKASQKK